MATNSVLTALAGAAVTLVILLYCSWPSRPAITERSVQIVVLGDIGRSPRMQYHALSISKHGGTAEIVGFLESEPLHDLKENPAIRFNSLPSSPPMLNTSNKALFLMTAPLKVLFQVLTLWKALACQPQAYEWMLVQNPPSIPTMLLAVLACRIRKTKLVIDWHNFGYSILALKLGDHHPFVKISKAYEQSCGRLAYAHFAVTNAMCEVLKTQFAIVSSVFRLHDRPAPLFVPLSDKQRSAFITRHELTSAEAPEILTRKMRLLVSSTSWTADEDFSVLLDALRSYSESATSHSPQLPELFVVITGKGPLHDYYLGEIQQMEARQELEMVTIKTAWLPFEDYASLLGAADLGISLHKSSSGVDLPMKVVDMFGAGLPVLGYNNFKAWPELVQENVNGKGFANSRQMSDQLKLLFDPANQTLSRLKEGAVNESKRRWESEWDPIAGKLFGLVT